MRLTSVGRANGHEAAAKSSDIRSEFQANGRYIDPHDAPRGQYLLTSDSLGPSDGNRSAQIEIRVTMNLPWRPREAGAGGGGAAGRGGGGGGGGSDEGWDREEEEGGVPSEGRCSHCATRKPLSRRESHSLLLSLSLPLSLSPSLPSSLPPSLSLSLRLVRALTRLS